MMSDMDELTLAKIREAHVVNGIPGDHHKIPYRNIRHLLSTQAKVSPSKTFLIHYDAEGNREELTYGDINARVHQTAHFLYDDLGVRRGDRVATIGYNHSDTVIIYFACWILGAAVAPQNVAEDDRRIAFILRNSEAVTCLVREEYLERAETIIHGETLTSNPSPSGRGGEKQTQLSTSDGLGAPNIRQIVQVGGQPREGYIHFHEMVKNLPNTFFSDEGEPTLEDEALLVYTSGTTGAPKGVVLTQYNLLIDAQGIAQWQAITGNQRLMCVLPIHHVNGIVVTLVTPLFVGASVVLNRQFSSSTFWRRITAERVNVVSVVPTLLQFCLDYADQQQAKGQPMWGEGIHQQDMTHFRHIVCGAGTLAMALARAFEERFGVPILHGYGLSETTCYSCHLPVDLDWDTHKHWMLDFGYPSIGCPIDPNEMAVFSADGSGQRMNPGERGEICIRGHNVMTGYFKRPDANTETFKFGWFRSGDEGFYEVDERGRQFFFITGRIKELINRGGVKFDPFSIEEVMLEIPGVKVALAIGFDNKYHGEEVGAYIVMKEGIELIAEEIIAYCRTRMPFEKTPKVVIFGQEIPVTTTGKYQRMRLKDLYKKWEDVQFREK